MSCFQEFKAKVEVADETKVVETTDECDETNKAVISIVENMDLVDVVEDVKNSEDDSRARPEGSEMSGKIKAMYEQKKNDTFSESEDDETTKQSENEEENEVLAETGTIEADNASSEEESVEPQPIKPKSCKRKRSSEDVDQESDKEAKPVKKRVVKEEATKAEKPKPSSRKRNKRLCVYEHLDVSVFTVRPQDLDPTATAYQNTINLIRQRIPENSHIRNLAEFIDEEKKLVTFDTIMLPEKRLKTFGLAKPLKSMFDKHRFFFAANLPVSLNAMESGDDILCVNRCAIHHAFRVVLPNSYGVYSYLLTSVSVVLDQMINKLM